MAMQDEVFMQGEKWPCKVKMPMQGEKWPSEVKMSMQGKNG